MTAAPSSHANPCVVAPGTLSSSASSREPLTARPTHAPNMPGGTPGCGTSSRGGSASSSRLAAASASTKVSADASVPLLGSCVRQTVAAAS